MLNDNEISKIYSLICKYYKKYLKKHNVRLPSLHNKSNKGYTEDALVLIRLALNYPNTDIITKEKLTLFVRNYYPSTNDVQQARHLTIQQGWFIISRTRGKKAEFNIPKNTYKLFTLEEKYPSYIPNRRTGVSTKTFEKLKTFYGYKCAVCSSKKGKPHRIRKNCITKLQEGHMNPCKDLIQNNIIPQCQICNRSDRNRWIYDNTGKVIKIADTEDGKRIMETFIKNTSKNTRYSLYNLLKQLLLK